MKNLLPLGSVISLNGVEHRIMILGYARYKENDKSQLYDYVGCYFPEGYTGNKNGVIFNHSDISSLFYLGYTNADSVAFMQKVNEVMDSAAPSVEEQAFLGDDAE